MMRVSGGKGDWRRGFRLEGGVRRGEIGEKGRMCVSVSKE